MLSKNHIRLQHGRHLQAKRLPAATNVRLVSPHPADPLPPDCGSLAHTLGCGVVAHHQHQVRAALRRGAARGDGGWVRPRASCCLTSMFTRHLQMAQQVKGQAWCRHCVWACEAKCSRCVSEPCSCEARCAACGGAAAVAQRGWWLVTWCGAAAWLHLPGWCSQLVQQASCVCLTWSGPSSAAWPAASAALSASSAAAFSAAACSTHETWFSAPAATTVHTPGLPDRRAHVRPSRQ